MEALVSMETSNIRYEEMLKRFEEWGFKVGGGVASSPRNVLRIELPDGWTKEAMPRRENPYSWIQAAMLQETRYVKNGKVEFTDEQFWTGDVLKEHRVSFATT